MLDKIANRRRMYLLGKQTKNYSTYNFCQRCLKRAMRAFFIFFNIEIVRAVAQLTEWALPHQRTRVRIQSSPIYIWAFIVILILVKKTWRKKKKGYDEWFVDISFKRKDRNCQTWAADDCEERERSICSFAVFCCMTSTIFLLLQKLSFPSWQEKGNLNPQERNLDDADAE